MVTPSGGATTARTKMNGRNISIVGAGPAGLMAAEYLAARGAHVTVYERMPSPARKFLMAGRGGLNLTHSEAPANFIARYSGSAAPLVHAAVAAFPPSRLIDWANELGVATFIGSSGRVFPKAMKASPLLRAWLRRLDSLGVELKTGWTWRGFADGPTQLVFEAPGGVERVDADAVLLALGGASWPRLGSDGAWFPILERAGIVLAPLQPSNCGVSISWSPHLAKHAGAPLKRIAITCGRFTQKGEAVVTRDGLESGAIYALSPHIREALRTGPVRITLDLKPDQTADTLAHQLERAPPKCSTTTLLRKAAALSAAAAAVAREAGPLPRTPADLAARLKAVPLSVTGLAGLPRAISTAGGIAADALDAHGMLRARPGVFAAGEMLDFDAPTGGYLLQAAFATGIMAAEGIAQWFALSDHLKDGNLTHTVSD